MGHEAQDARAVLHYRLDGMESCYYVQSYDSIPSSNVAKLATLFLYVLRDVFRKLLDLSSNPFSKKKLEVSLETFWGVFSRLRLWHKVSNFVTDQRCCCGLLSQAKVLKEGTQASNGSQSSC